MGSVESGADLLKCEICIMDCYPPPPAHALQLVVKLVPDAPDGQNVPRRIRVGFDFLSQLSDERYDVVVIQQIIIRPSYK